MWLLSVLLVCSLFLGINLDFLRPGMITLRFYKWYYFTNFLSLIDLIFIHFEDMFLSLIVKYTYFLFLDPSTLEVGPTNLGLSVSQSYSNVFFLVTDHKILLIFCIKLVCRKKVMEHDFQEKNWYLTCMSWLSKHWKERTRSKVGYFRPILSSLMVFGRQIFQLWLIQFVWYYNFEK